MNLNKSQKAVAAKIALEQQKRLQAFVDLHRDEIDEFDVVNDSMSVHFKDEVSSARVGALMGELFNITGTIQLPG